MKVRSFKNRTGPKRRRKKKTAFYEFKNLFFFLLFFSLLLSLCTSKMISEASGSPPITF
jgi:hypothetical protein